jgi:hypothetical protein
LLISNDQALSRMGAALASLLTDGKALLEGLASGASAIWHTASGPVSALLVFLLIVSLTALKRLVGNGPNPSEA